ncbi:GAF and ANTAR domain-containing protein [Pseudonocardia sichuanensis]
MLLLPRGTGNRAATVGCEHQQHDEYVGTPGHGPAELQELLLTSDTVQEFLGEVAAAAARELGPDRFSCAVTVRTHQRRPTTLGTSDSFAAALDEVQYGQDQGPCLHALRTGEIVEMTDIAADERWPRFAALAAEQGSGSALSLPLGTGPTGVVGALNVYGRTPDAFTDDDRERARRYAAQAAAAVAIGVRLAQRAELSEDLRAGLSSRATIDQAIGIVMAQRRCDADAAFAVLRELSQTSNTKLREVAAQVIAHVTGPSTD